MPGADVTLTCNVIDSGVFWNSSWFVMPVQVNSVVLSAAESGITLQLDIVSVDPLCATATATITKIQESMDGLDLTCFTTVGGGFTSTVLFDVIGKPKLNCQCILMCL